jgi:hypothetical protein
MTGRRACAVAVLLLSAGHVTVVEMGERQVTSAAHGHILTNVGVWSPDGCWIVYDVRSDPAGSVFDDTRIERVEVATGRVETLYESKNGACCGVATCSPTDGRVAFILGPENPTPDWTYGPDRRQGVIVDSARPGIAAPLDARDLVPPFTPGALRGGSHVHVFSGDGRWVSFTYEDHVLTRLGPTGTHDRNQRTVGVSAPFGPVAVRPGHPRNHSGTHFSVVVADTVNEPKPGSDEIDRAYEDAWVGRDGYARPDGTRQRRALAFLGDVRDERGAKVAELFLVDLPEDVRTPGKGPLEGTATTRPRPPRGATQRRLTRTTHRPHPGLGGPRFWPRSSPDGARIAFLMRDDGGIVQLWTVSPDGDPPAQLTRNATDVASAFTWSPDGRWLAHVLDGSVCVTSAATGRTHRLTPRSPAAEAPRPEACVFSPDGSRIAYVRPVESGGKLFNQVFVCQPNFNELRDP